MLAMARIHEQAPNHRELIRDEMRMRHDRGAEQRQKQRVAVDNRRVEQAFLVLVGQMPNAVLLSAAQGDPLQASDR